MCKKNSNMSIYSVQVSELIHHVFTKHSENFSGNNVFKLQEVKSDNYEMHKKKPCKPTLWLVVH